jgi:hypothetical protein
MKVPLPDQTRPISDLYIARPFTTNQFLVIGFFLLLNFRDKGGEKDLNKQEIEVGIMYLGFQQEKMYVIW